MIEEVKMRILFTIGTLGGGGAERNVALLANGLVNQGYEVGILTIWGEEQVYTLDERIRHIALEPQSTNKLKRFIKQLFCIRPSIKEYNPDLIISFLADVNACVLLCSRGLRSKVIISERNDPHIDPTIKIFRFLRKVTYPFADGYVFQTKEAMKYFAKAIQGKPTAIISNPVREDLPCHQDNNSKIIVTACRLSKQKNLPMLVDAFAYVYEQHPDYKLHIYGEGELKDELQAYIEEKQLEKAIVLKGFDKDVCKKINDAEIFVLSSDYEGMSNSMLEALAIGMPVVVTDCPIGGARALIRNGENGVLIPVGDTERFGKAILSLIEEKGLKIRLSEEARKIKSSNSVEAVLGKWIKFVNIVLKRK